MVKSSLIAFFLLSSLSAVHAANDRLSDLLSQSLIIGASMSADYAAESPGKKLIRKYGKPEAMTVYAKDGATGASRIAAYSTPDKLKGFSSVLGLDLFFWDSVFDCDHVVNSIRGFVFAAREAKAVLVLGTVPAIPIPGGNCRNVVNTALRAECVPALGCMIFDLEAIYQDVRLHGVVFQGKRYELSEVLADGLHPNDIGSSILEERLSEDLKRTFP